MNIDRKRVYATALFCPPLALLLVLLVSNITWKNWMLAVLISTFAIASWIMIPKRSKKDLPYREVSIIVTVFSMTVLMLYYLTGLNFGFYRNPIADTYLLRYILPFLVMIVTGEVFRSVMLQQKMKIIQIFLYFVMVLIEMLMLMKGNAFESFNSFREMTAIFLFPALTGNLLYHYLTQHYGMWPSVIYRSVFALYPYLMTSIPKTPDAFVAFFKMLLPLVLLLFVKTLYQKRHFAAVKKKSAWNTVLGVLICAVMLQVLMLISCQFKYGLLVVGSESMTGAVDKGDAIIYVQYKGQLIKNDEIAVFKSGGTTYIHRVVNIENIDGQTRYTTKGDANDGVDAGFVTNSDIIGIVTHKIKYIGLPTVWVRDFFK